MIMQTFRESLKLQLEQCSTASTADEVRKALVYAEEFSAGECFFSGDGDDLFEALIDARWKPHRWQAMYYWVVTNEAGEFVSYTEGDVNFTDNTMCDSQ